MSNLKQKYQLPAIPHEMTSPTAQRIFLEECILECRDELFKNIATAKDGAERLSSGREIEIEFRVKKTLADFSGIESITPCHYAKMFVGGGIDNSFCNRDESALVWIYQIASIPSLEDVITDIVDRGLKILHKKSLGRNHRQYFVLNGSLDELVKKVRDYHAKALDAEIAKLKADAAEVEEQLALFNKHCLVRMNEIKDIFEYKAGKYNLVA